MLDTLPRRNDFRDEDIGTLFLNRVSALDAPRFRLRTAGQDATNVLVVVLGVDVVDENV